MYPSVPAKVEYELIDVRRSLIKSLSALSEWVQRTQPAIEAARASRKSVE
jgi:DNA-binding HxlR family transcriptional regulator